MYTRWPEFFSNNPELSYFIPRSTTKNAVAKAIGPKETIIQTFKNIGELIRRTVKKIPDPQHLENLYPSQKK